MKTRRHFLHTAALTASGLALSTQAAPAKGKHTLCTFTKHLQGLPFDQLSDLIAQVGLDGIEAPVRPGGHVEPERVTEDLPKLIDALKRTT